MFSSPRGYVLPCRDSSGSNELIGTATVNTYELFRMLYDIDLRSDLKSIGERLTDMNSALPGSSSSLSRFRTLCMCYCLRCLGRKTMELQLFNTVKPKKDGKNSGVLVIDWARLVYAR